MQRQGSSAADSDFSPPIATSRIASTTDRSPECRSFAIFAPEPWTMLSMRRPIRLANLRRPPRFRTITPFDMRCSGRLLHGHGTWYHHVVFRLDSSASSRTVRDWLSRTPRLESGSHEPPRRPAEYSRSLAACAASMTRWSFCPPFTVALPLAPIRLRQLARSVPPGAATSDYASNCRPSSRYLLAGNARLFEDGVHITAPRSSHFDPDAHAVDTARSSARTGPAFVRTAERSAKSNPFRVDRRAY